MPTLRFVQTSDWHLGQAYGNVADAELAGRLRRARLEAVGRVLGAAERLGAAFVLVAGDQFEGSLPDRDTVRGMLDRIGDHPRMPVHMIPGNHDPADAGSVYRRAEITRDGPPNLHVHGKPEPVPLPEHGATLYPCPCLAKHGDDPMDWIPRRAKSDGLRIGLAHGSLPRFAGSGDRNYPIRDDAPEFYGLDYIALGDWHTANPDPLTSPRDRMYYAGAPEVGGWDETGAGTFLEVNLASDQPPEVRAHPIRQYDWIEWAGEVHEAADVARFLDGLARKASKATVLRARPRGALTVADRMTLEAGIVGKVGDFAFLELDPRDLRPAQEGEVDLPRDPLIREAYARLLRLAADPADGPPAALPKDLPGLDREVVARALTLFRNHLP